MFLSAGEGILEAVMPRLTEDLLSGRVLPLLDTRELTFCAAASF